MQDGDQVLDRLAGFGNDAATDDLAVFHRNLAGNMEPAIGFHRTGEGQGLSTGTGFAGAITLDGHRIFSLFVFCFEWKRDAGGKALQTFLILFS